MVMANAAISSTGRSMTVGLVPLDMFVIHPIARGTMVGLMDVTGTRAGRTDEVSADC